jgi:uncharacterized cupredoxin-like copper-binding protein
MWSASRRGLARPAALVGVAALLVGVSGCQTKDSQGDLLVGKTMFNAACSSCHALKRAGSKAQIGPDLDGAFARAKYDGFGDDQIRGIVYKQILYPATREPIPGAGAVMPHLEGSTYQVSINGQSQKLKLTKDVARDIASYVAYAAAAPGKDPASLGSNFEQKPLAVAKNGTLDLAAAPTGQTLFDYKNARAQAGALTITMKNVSSVQHNIAVEGNGVSTKGPLVTGPKGVSQIKVNLKPGTYTFYCSVPGHRQGGMVGKLTVG